MDRGNGLESWARVDRIHRYTSIVDTRDRNREFAGEGGVALWECMGQLFLKST